MDINNSLSLYGSTVRPIYISIKYLLITIVNLIQSIHNCPSSSSLLLSFTCFLVVVRNRDLTGGVIFLLTTILLMGLRFKGQSSTQQSIPVIAIKSIFYGRHTQLTSLSLSHTFNCCRLGRVPRIHRNNF